MPPETTETTTTPTSNQNQSQADTTSSGQSHDGTPVGTIAPTTQTNEGDKTGTVTDWKSSLPEDLRSEKTFETIKDVPSLAKSYLEMRKAYGSSLRMPGDTATKEEREEFYKKIGWESDVEKLGVKGPILPEGMEMKDEEVKNFASYAVKDLYLTPKQIQGVMDYYGNFVKGVIPDYKGDAEKAGKALSEQWGAAVDRNMGVARRALFTEFPKETVDKITQTGLANDPGFIMGMFERGKTLIENGVIPEEIGQGVDENSAKAKIAEMEGDPKSPLWNKEDPRHQEFVDKRANLYKVVYAK